MNILVLCTGNSCRSQIAEGYLRHFAKDKATIYSAGIEAHGVNPKAVQIMQEDGISLKDHSSKTIDTLSHISFDVLFTVCDHAAENCPHFPSNGKTIHHNFQDPAKASGSEEEIMAVFRKVRNEIKQFCQQLIADNIPQ